MSPDNNIPDVVDITPNSFVWTGPEGEGLGELTELLVDGGQGRFVDLLVLGVILQRFPAAVNVRPALKFVQVESLELCISGYDGPAANQGPAEEYFQKLQFTVLFFVPTFNTWLPVFVILLDTLHQLLLVAEVGVPLAGDDGVRHHLVHRLVLGQQGAVATCLFFLLNKSS